MCIRDRYNHAKARCIISADPHIHMPSPEYHSQLKFLQKLFVPNIRSYTPRKSAPTNVINDHTPHIPAHITQSPPPPRVSSHCIPHFNTPRWPVQPPHRWPSRG
eukprot:TRINITY_DN38697_c0_g1_i2.p2 TRINITY_DN38697_c0_g1~~TRINITY_DN38697_c0_g1_i2.p2  ORF type:complete len:104 (-),score=1.55 TRINITY_DN38697_c0_g1_i2:276-587(-)